jgi:hypothetical protein
VNTLYKGDDDDNNNLGKSGNDYMNWIELTVGYVK